MLKSGKAFVWVAALAFVSGTQTLGQDSQSLGDAARQARQQKQNKTGKDTKGQAPPKVITEDDISRPSETAVSASGANGSDHGVTDSQAKPDGNKLSADAWKSQIVAQKQAVANLQHNMEEINQSIQFAPGNCVSGCVQWNEQQKQKQADVERMRAELETQKQRLQQMQESARQQGYGSSVSDP
jgi:hypothetical protein